MLKAPDAAAYTTLDVVAESMKVSTRTYQELWGAMVVDDRDRDGWTPGEFAETSPNNMVKCWNKLSDEAKLDVIEAFKKEEA
jgi:hypothetical protein